MFLYIFCTFLLGIITAPILAELVIIYFIEKFARKRYPYKPDNLKMTSNQQKIFMQSLHKAKDVAWANLWLQRHWYELAHSYAHKDRIVRNIMKKMNILKRRKIITDAIVEYVELSSEAPILKSMTVLTQSQYNDILAICEDNTNKKTVKMIEERLEKDGFVNSEEKFFDCMDKSQSRIDKSSKYGVDSDISAYSDLEDISSVASRFPNNKRKPKRKSSRLRKSAKKKTATNLNPEDLNFDQIFFLVDLEYSKYSTFHITTTFLKYYKIETICSIGNFSGKALLRLPANNQKNKWEISFIEDPGFKIFTEAFFAGQKKGSQYLKGFFSNLFKRILYQSIKRRLIFPHFHSFLIPSVTANLKYVDHTITEFQTDKHEEWCRDLTNQLFLYISMNYKILRKENFIILRRNSYYINGERDRIHLLEIDFNNLREMSDVPVEKSVLEDPSIFEADSQSVNWTGEINTCLSEESRACKTLNTGEIEDTGNDMTSIEDGYFIDIGKEAKKREINLNSWAGENIQGTQKIVDELKLITNLNTFNSNILSHFYNLGMLKYVSKDFLYLKKVQDVSEKVSRVKLFFKKSVFEFIRIVRNDTIIFQRNSIKEPEFIVIRIMNGRVQLFYYLINKTLFFGFKQGQEIRESILKNKMVENEPGFEVNEMETRDTQNHIKTFREMVERKEGTDKVILNFDISSKDLREIIDDPIIRFRLMGFHVKITDVQQICENTQLYSIKVAEIYRKNLKIVCFSDGSRIIDAEILSGNLICSYTIKKLDEKSSLEVTFSRPLESNLRRFFISPVLIRTKPFNSCFKPLSLTFTYDKSFGYKFECDPGIILLEFFSEIPDDFYLTVKIDNLFLFSNQKIITTKKNRILFSIKQKGEIKIHLRPKLLKNRKFYLTIAQTKKTTQDDQNEFFVDIVTSLAINRSIDYKIGVGKENILFWDLEYEENLVEMVSSKNYKSMISGFGILIAEDDVYRITVKNRGPKNRNIRFCVGATVNKLG